MSGLYNQPDAGCSFVEHNVPGVASCRTHNLIVGVGEVKVCLPIVVTGVLVLQQVKTGSIRGRLIWDWT